MGQSYATASCTTGTPGIIPKSSEKGVTLTVISVVYNIIAFLPTTGESAWESSSVLEVEVDVDDAEIFRTTLIWCANAEDIYNPYPVSNSSASSLFQLLWFNHRRADLVALVYLDWTPYWETPLCEAIISWSGGRVLASCSNCSNRNSTEATFWFAGVVVLLLFLSSGNRVFCSAWTAPTDRKSVVQFM